LIVAGVMSGTSADGIDVALVRCGAKASGKTTYVGHAAFAYPKKVRRFILQVMNAQTCGAADIARLNVLLAELYAKAVKATERQLGIRAELIGCHGQTIYHQGEAAHFLGHNIATTMQIGEGAVLAARLGVPVVSDFRPADMAAGGKGAPLVPFLDYRLYRDPRIGRIVQNIGGIANLSAIPAAASADDLVAFDTGPGNMIIDAVTEQLFGKPYDRNGKLAASGKVLNGVLTDCLRLPFFRRNPPKTAGREEFGDRYVRAFLAKCRKRNKHDIVATATALTAHSIANAVHRLVLRNHTSYREMIVSGGGTRNATLMSMLAGQIAPLGLELRLSDELGIPSQAKEAVAFAVMAYETWNHRPSNVPSATGAKHPAILGKISYA
jgi:anhydro-N-acetylmuramic acid kinase